MRIILGILVSAIAIVIAAYIVPGVQIDSFWTAVIVAIVLAVVNGLLGSLLRLLTLPVNILTLGLVSFIITVLMIMLVSSLVDGFDTGGFLATAVFAIVLALVNMVFGVDKVTKV
ncbi:phage holin family protein [Patescibacteria group bacterium]|nr:phage holin family protein [Patescibacteria group bacterium]